MSATSRTKAPASRPPARKPPALRFAAGPAVASASERRGGEEESAIQEPERLEADTAEGEEGEEIAALAAIGDDDEDITPTPIVPEEEESEW